MNAVCTLILFLFVNLCVGLSAAAQSSARQPNIIFILTDDQGYGDLSCTGNPILKTPNLDRLHDEGVRFTDFHVSPTCSPTRSALLTGRHEFKNGVTHTIYERERLTRKATTLAQVLRSAGYATGIFGKWHLGDEDAYQPNRRGFEEVFIHGAGGIGQTYPGSCGDAPGNTYFNPAILHNGKFEKTEGYCTDVFFRQATRWIEAKKGKNPFFAYIACNAPHEPLQVRPEDEARYTYKVNDPKVAKFFGMIANIDDNVGRLLERLKAWGIERDTLIIFMNDNGGTGGVKVYNAGMRGQKVTAFLGGTRAASFWRWPGTLKPADVHALAAHIDFFPTLAEIAGARLSQKVKQQIEGRSLVPLLKNPTAPWADRILFTHVGRWPKGTSPALLKYANCSVRSPQWHLVSASQGSAKNWMLFDVKADPGEQKDIEAQHPNVVRELDAAFDHWWDSVQPMLVNEDAAGPAVNPFKARYWKQFGGGPEPTAKPNILIILADDMGYSDIGCYGGEVQTPNLNRLAKNGLRYTQFYNTARCWPSRAALLTGYYAQQVRRDTVPGVTPSGAQGVRPGWARLLPNILKPLGYRSYHSGKWHIDGLPLKNGFDHSYRLEDHDRHFAPRSHFEDDMPLAPVAPDSGYYTTTAIAEHCIKTLKEHKEKYPNQPFFSYLAFTAPHFPLHALPEDIQKYRNRFREGWDALRVQRLKRMKSLGIVHCELWARTPGVPAWDSLTSAQKEMWTDRMEIHAAMIDRMDREIGRVLNQLRAMKALENTVIFFLSDNGASAEKIDRGDKNDPNAVPGSAKSFLCLEPGWANLANTPLRRSKIFVHEGGISTPLIVHWPGGLKAKGELRHNPGHLIDLVPTILELVGGKKPDIWDGNPIPPAPGRSLAPTFLKDDTVAHDYLWWFHSDNRALRVGDWKLVSAGINGPWELFDLRADRSESHNLAARYPEKVQELEKVWKSRLEEFRALAAKDAPPNP